MEGLDSRDSRDKMFWEIANVVSRRSTCTRGNVGAVVVRDSRIISLGYNGTPPGHDHCQHHKDEVLPNGCQHAIHAEANALAWAARAGISTEGATMYCTHGPCLKCAQLMLAAGLVKLYYDTPYRSDEGLWLLQDTSGFECINHTYI